MCDQCFCGAADQSCEGTYRIAHYKEAGDGEKHTDNADRKVVHQHLEAAPDASFGQLVELLYGQTARRPHNHRAYEHRNVAARDYSYCSYRAGYSASVARDVLARRIGDKNRKEIGQCG